MNAATPHRATLILLVGLAAAAVVAGLVPMSPTLERFMLRLPAMPTTAIALGFAAVGLLGFAVWADRAAEPRRAHPRTSCGARGDRARRAQLRHPEPAARAAPERGRERRSPRAARRPLLDRRRRARRRLLERRAPAATRDALPVARGAQHPRRLDGGRRLGRPGASSCACGAAVRASSCRSSCRRDAPCDSPWPMRRSSPSCAAGRRSTALRSRPRASSCRPLTAAIPIIRPRQAAAARTLTRRGPSPGDAGAMLDRQNPVSALTRPPFERG